MITIRDLLQITIDKEASDLHIIAGYYPTIRVNHQILPLRTLEVIDSNTSQILLEPLLNEDQKHSLISNREIDIGYEYDGYRFRINLYYAQGKLAAAFRLIPRKIKTIEELNLPASFHGFTNFKQGLVLVTGPTGEGKSTTIASLLNELNLNSTSHIVTIEDPIEFVYPTGKSIVSQRELHQDTYSWNVALKSVLREDPDIVLVGEMRDYDTVQAVLTIAETGHLVFSTLHTNSTPETIDRIIDVFPAHQQNQVRSQLASVLKVVVSQRLLPHINNTERIPGIEILSNTNAVANLIREGKTFLLNNVIETSEEDGMLLFEKNLVQLVRKGLITKEVALIYALRRNEIQKFLT